MDQHHAYAIESNVFDHSDPVFYWHSIDTAGALIGGKFLNKKLEKIQTHSSELVAIVPDPTSAWLPSRRSYIDSAHLLSVAGLKGYGHNKQQTR
jgi:hypothetical protein